MQLHYDSLGGRARPEVLRITEVPDPGHAGRANDPDGPYFSRKTLRLLGKSRSDLRSASDRIDFPKAA